MSRIPPLLRPRTGGPNAITNESQFETHPLQGLLEEAIWVENGGEADFYDEAKKVSGWTFQFLGWCPEAARRAQEGKGEKLALYELTWDSQATLDELAAIVRSAS